MVPDSQVLVEKIVRLQRHIARKQEKLDFLEEHMGTMTEEVKKKNRIIVEYVMKAEAGIMSTENMDENKVSQWRWRWRIWFKRFAPFCFWCNSTHLLRAIRGVRVLFQLSITYFLFYRAFCISFALNTSTLKSVTVTFLTCNKELLLVLI